MSGTRRRKKSLQIAASAAVAASFGLALPQALGVAQADSTPTESAATSSDTDHGTRGPVRQQHAGPAAAKRASSVGRPRPFNAAATPPAAAVRPGRLLTAPAAASPAPLAVRSVDRSAPAAAQAARPLLKVTHEILATARNTLGQMLGGDPASPAASPFSWALLAAAGRDLTAAPNLASAGAGAHAVAAASDGPITISPVIPQLTDGIINGTISAVDSKDLPLFYSVARQPSTGGKVSLNPDTGKFSYLPIQEVLNAGGTEKFKVLVSEQTRLVGALAGVIDLPDWRNAVLGIVTSLQQLPIVNLVLAPLIGRAKVEEITVDNGKLVPTPAVTPVAYTVKVKSFDDVMISTNYFPAAGLKVGEKAPAVLTTTGMSSPGNIDPYGEWDTSILFAHVVPGIAPLRAAGYDVITWDSRGKADSGGVLELGAGDYEGRDFNAIIDHYTGLNVIATDGSNNPLIGSVGGSYGGGMQLVNALVDPRIKATVPAIGWNSLTAGLYPSDQFNTFWGVLLPVGLATAGARINPQVYMASVIGTITGWMPKVFKDLLARTGPGEQADKITAPTLLIQGIPDTTFPLQEAVLNAELIGSNGTPVKMIWYCGGHGVCLNPENPNNDKLILDASVGWLDRYVKGITPPAEMPTFQWVDQFGHEWGSDLMPYDPGFKGTPFTATGKGGFLPLIGLLGAATPYLKELPLSLLATSRASNAVNVSLTAASDAQVVGSPTVSFTYKGLGSAHHVFAQIVDNDSGLVLSNGVTPIAVKLDGRSHTVSVNIADVAENVKAGEKFTLQLTNGAMPFYDALAYGTMKISDVTFTLPTIADGVAKQLTGSTA